MKSRRRRKIWAYVDGCDGEVMRRFHTKGQANAFFDQQEERPSLLWSKRAYVGKRLRGFEVKSNAARSKLREHQ
jgi:hypothetical protein